MRQLVKGVNGSPKNELIALVSLIRKVSGIDKHYPLMIKQLIKISRNGYLKNRQAHKIYRRTNAMAAHDKRLCGQ